MAERGHRRFRIFTIMAVAGVLLVLGLVGLRNIGNNMAVRGSGGSARASTSTARIDTIYDASAEVTRRQSDARGASGREVVSRETTRSTSATSAVDYGAERLMQQSYVEALLTQMEQDGKDNAMLHYALAFELAPENPTNEQRALINKVLDEGWSEEANELLPYLMEWEAALEEIMKGAALDYARGPNPETAGWETPSPDMQTAQSASRMVSVYSRYLESQGRLEEARVVVQAALSMGQDFAYQGNLSVVSMVGNGIQSMGLRQVRQMAEAGVYKGVEQQAIAALREAEISRPFLLTAEADAQRLMAGIQKGLTDREYYTYLQEVNPGRFTRESLTEMAQEQKQLEALQSEYFSKPYYARRPLRTDPDNPAFERLQNIREVEARELSILSRMRQQQIDLAAQKYLAEHNRPPANIYALVESNYLPQAPQDPFTGEAFIYEVDGEGYQLYGGGPVTNVPIDAAVEWSAQNGTFSPGVIKFR